MHLHYFLRRAGTQSYKVAARTTTGPMGAGSPLKSSAAQGLLYSLLVGLLLLWSYLHVDEDLRETLLNRFCEPNISTLLHEESKTINGYSKTLSSAVIPVGAATDLVIAVQAEVCSDFKEVVDFIDTALFIMVIVKAAMIVMYIIVFIEPSMINKPIINLCLVAYIGGVVTLTLIIVAILAGSVIKFKDRVFGLDTEKRETPEMLLAAVVLGGLFEIVGFLMYAFAVSNIDPNAVAAAEIKMEETRAAMNPEAGQIEMQSGATYAYGKKNDTPYVGTTAVPLGRY